MISFSITTLNIKIHSFVFQGYQEVTRSGYCTDPDGNSLSSCYKWINPMSLYTPLENACEDACESSNSCVGYTIYFNSNGDFQKYQGNHYCSLFPSSQSFSDVNPTCPDGFMYDAGDSWTTMAETSDDLKALTHQYLSGYSCYAKN